MTRARAVKSQAAALAPPASAGDALPTRAPKVSMADALENEKSGLGTTRDKRTHSTYGGVTRLNEHAARVMVRKSWLADAIVSTPVEDGTREWVSVKWDGMQAADEALIRRITRRFRLKAKTQSGWQWARQFGGAAIVIIVAGEDPETPLDVTKIRKGSVRRLLVKDRTWVTPLPGAPDRNIEGERRPGEPEEIRENYAMPTYYQVRGSSVRFHHTRIVRFEGHEVSDDDFLTNGYWHDSELQHVVTATMDYDGSTENIASLLWEAKLDVIKTTLAAMIAKKDGRAALEKRYRDAVEGKSNHRLLLINEDEEYTQKNVTMAGFANVLSHFVVQACGAARIPMVKLFGQSAPGLNSTGETDIDIYFDRIAAEVERVVLPPLLYLYEILVRNELGRLPEGFDVVPNPLWQLSTKETVELDAKRAEMHERYVEMGAVTVGLIARELFSLGVFKSMTDKDVKLAESMEQPIEPEKDDEPDDDPAPHA
jgi:uncharacterized protein